MKKSFLITVDTEGDNLWQWKIGDPVLTENAKFIPKFQELCERHGFIPTYLTNYEMATDSFFVDYFGKKQEDGKCEIGMHLHAWNSPPDFELPVRDDAAPGQPYLIEYPPEIMEEKIAFMTELIEKNFGRRPTSHRAGRWAMNDKYFELLKKYGYEVDCSVTPLVNWERSLGQTPGSRGSDYSSEISKPHLTESGILEVPMTVIENHRLRSGLKLGIRSNIDKIREARRGRGALWFRPASTKSNLEDLMYVEKCVRRNHSTDYIMFMLHSSELMPGGSPRFASNESIDILFSDMDTVFLQANNHFVGKSTSEFGRSLIR